ncbi:hypothetical protein BDZ45DRAFT_184345 [Acephala macrosclerotiorum]|nr:hypothetical protein BDZ45DRAFT_184345 [Acephala macrosclerotiorum]
MICNTQPSSCIGLAHAMSSIRATTLRQPLPLFYCSSTPNSPLKICHGGWGERRHLCLCLRCLVVMGALKTLFSTGLFEFSPLTFVPTFFCLLFEKAPALAIGAPIYVQRVVCGRQG